MSAPPGDVVDRLERLSAHAPTAVAAPDVLWVRGRRRQRRAWVAVAACAVVLAGVGAAVVPPVLRLSDPPVAVSPGSSGLVLPDHVREPGLWEPEFSAAPGPLTAVGVGSRSGWLSTRGAWWGVSGTTGESRFLDLPDASVEIEAMPALSADGTRLAYWVTGETPQTLPDPDALHPDDALPIVGVAVLDLVTGDVRRWATDSPRGKAPVGMAWAGDVLWWSSGDWDEHSTATQGGYVVVNRTWDLSTDERTDLPRSSAGGRLSLAPTAPSPEGFLAATRHGLRSVTARGLEPSIRLDRSLLAQESSMPAIGPGGTRIAGIEQVDPQVVDDAPHRLLVGDLAPGGVARLEPAPGIEAHAVLGWQSDRDVVVLNGRDASVVDVGTGARRPLLDFAGNVPEFAGEAWAGDLVDAPDAPFAPDPRLVAFMLGLVLVAGTSVWRSVRRRRGHP